MTDSDAPISDGSIGVSILVPRAVVPPGSLSGAQKPAGPRRPFPQWSPGPRPGRAPRIVPATGTGTVAPPGTQCRRDSGIRWDHLPGGPSGFNNKPLGFSSKI